jgi:hypothetical protein
VRCCRRGLLRLAQLLGQLSIAAGGTVADVPCALRNCWMVTNVSAKSQPSETSVSVTSRASVALRTVTIRCSAARMRSFRSSPISALCGLMLRPPLHHRAP